MPHPCLHPAPAQLPLLPALRPRLCLPTTAHALFPPLPPRRPQRNYRYFLLFVSCTALLCAWVFGVSLADLILASRDAGWDFGAIIGEGSSFLLFFIQLACRLAGWRVAACILSAGGAAGAAGSEPSRRRCTLLRRPPPVLRCAPAARACPSRPPALPRTACPAGSHWAAVVCAAYTFLAFWFVGGLSAFHAYLVSTNQTTYEHFRHRYSGERCAWSRGCAGGWVERARVRHRCSSEGWRR